MKCFIAILIGAVGWIMISGTNDPTMQSATHFIMGGLFGGWLISRQDPNPIRGFGMVGRLMGGLAIFEVLCLLAARMNLVR